MLEEEALNMSLDDLITKNKTKTKSKLKNHKTLPPPPPPSRRRRPPPPASAPGPTRRLPDHRASRTTPYSSPTVRFAMGFPNLASVMPAYRPAGGGVGAGVEGEGNLYVSNLRYTVSNSDIQMLFSEVGEVKRCGIHYDSDGRSQGTAEVVFARKSDAIAAIKRFNNSPLDGLHLMIELIGPESTYHPPMQPTVTNWQVAPPIPPSFAPWQMAPLTPQIVPPQWQMSLMPQAVAQWLRPGFKETPNHGFRDHEWHREGRYQGFDQRRIPQDKKLGKVSTEDLDADLEKYLSKRKNNTPYI